MLHVQVNGETRELAHELRLSELVEQLSLAPQRVAIELNHKVVRRNEWPTTIVTDGDRIEIVHFVGGGAEARPPGSPAEHLGWGGAVREGAFHLSITRH
ncbi:MAG TPA: sulfur carrier protein ThiS [Pyrinomonadaceae bacterium]|nr:sulfur carrier protein ThiS [Pyrinomonadaceae bacterium]